MRKCIILVTLLVAATSFCFAQQKTDDSKKSWANYECYASENQDKDAPVAVFMGNSITQGWASIRPEFFSRNNFLGRGIGGQVTAQMLARFRQDVLNLHPKAVVIMAGTNDIALNQQYVPIEHIAGNIFSMIELAQLHGIKVLLLSCLPVLKYSWRPEITDAAQQIATLNVYLESYAKINGVTYLDLHSVMKDKDGGLPKKYSDDGVHPTSEGYAVMEPLVIESLKAMGVIK